MSKYQRSVLSVLILLEHVGIYTIVLCGGLGVSFCTLFFLGDPTVLPVSLDGLVGLLLLGLLTSGIGFGCKHSFLALHH